jgi:hypothetical protein
MLKYGHLEGQGGDRTKYPLLIEERSKMMESINEFTFLYDF